ncbi:acetyl-CoA carboxylase biotin carboxyl carrier protein [Tamaricihabitans halophyticus]|uniref:Biotin carboxyl carrier protein of acetyl-CoA carboxylase n=1 Tax=Tamaricihabitans halophyticus TaxID=1262583 RepID=A0A4V2SV21_9PSEU|nr:biotin/lipoyl-containing protein [Tamaricihabitans halophyticus]TCP56786.1 acetyl-CoA carboxylase biotin carboxyl carrier protein [Tamaricihabitans halophyticus]
MSPSQLPSVQREELFDTENANGVDSIDAEMARLGADGALTALCRSVAEMARAGSHSPKRVRVKFGCASVEVEWPAAGRPAYADPPATDQDVEVSEKLCAPLVGTFYRASEPGAPPYVEVGTIVEAGQQVGIVEAMKLMNAVTTDERARIVEILVKDGESVEYGQPLFVIEAIRPEGSS